MSTILYKQALVIQKFAIGPILDYMTIQLKCQFETFIFQKKEEKGKSTEQMA